MSGHPSLIGIAPHHWPALQAVLLLIPAAWFGRRLVRRHAAAGADWALAIRDRWARSPVPVRWSAWLLAVIAVVHVALPLGHDGSPWLTMLFLGGGVGYAVLATRAVAGRRWRTATATLMAATIVAYLVVVGTGGEEADQVGLATVLAELTVLGLALVPALGARRTLRRVLVRPLASTAFVLAVVGSGVVVWGQTARDHDSAHAQAAGDGHDDHHGEYLARAQAGTILRPAGAAPTEAQLRAAAELVERTRAATARYRDLRVAEAEGYRLSGGPAEGLDLHYGRSDLDHDGRVLDPERPETLVYAAGNGRAVLLGVMFTVGRAGQPGPAVGGSSTRWHAHNVCVTPAPFGFGVQSPYGTCPFLSVAATTGEMIHLWTVDPPGGPWAAHLPEEWVRALLAREGRPY